MNLIVVYLMNLDISGHTYATKIRLHISYFIKVPNCKLDEKSS